MNNIPNITFSSLDPSQKNAFQAITSDESNLHIVHGPPGTGKSQLVVSLLEKFASEKKKVLFVSQNTEALKVVERMIKRTEVAIGYPVDNKYISLRDFCLMLYNPSHRHLKYLREQYTRIYGKELPSTGIISEPDGIQYILRYINLDHSENYRINGSSIGFDELVTYYLRYVNCSIAPEPIRLFDQVDVRKIFNVLDSYGYPDYFKEFNKPRRELILLSTDNNDLSLAEVRSRLRSIRDILFEDWTRFFYSKSSTTVLDHLTLLKEYVAATDFIDIYKISTEKKDLNELTQSIKAFIDSDNGIKKQIESIDNHLSDLNKKNNDVIAGVSSNTKKVHFNSSMISVAEKELDEVVLDYKRIEELIQVLRSQYPDIVHVSIQDVWVGLAKVIYEFYYEVIQDDEEFAAKLKSEDIITLNNDLQVFNAKNSIQRLISGVPVSFRKLLGFTNIKELQMYEDHLKEIFIVIKDILEINDSTIQSVLAVARKKTSVPLSRIGVKPAKNIQQARDLFLPVHELIFLLNKYSIAITDFSDTLDEITEFGISVNSLDAAISNSENKKFYLSHSLSGFIEALNVSIEREINIYKRKELLTQQQDLQIKSYRENGQYLSDLTEDTDYISRVNLVYEYLIHKEKSLTTLLKNIALPDESLSITADLDEIERVVDSARLSNNFSDFFFEMKAGQSIRDWLNSITVLETYNNDAEVVSFVEHNKSVNAIYSAMGFENKKYLDAVLANDISFEVFAARIVNAIVAESFSRSHITHKKRVTTKDIIDSYESYLKNQKVKMYEDHLKSMYYQSLDATKELSKQSTLQSGGKSTMDKFRHNTHLIANAFPIVCATPKDVSKYLSASKGLFDYVIFDEASQLLPGQALPSIYRAKKAVIIGDPHQMPPSLTAPFGAIESADDDFDDLGESILDLVLKQPQKQHHLKVHYRSKYNKLFEPSREAIYSNDGIEPIFEAQLSLGAPIDILDDLGDNIDEYEYDKNFYRICESINEYLKNNNSADFCILFTRADILLNFKDFLAEIGERKFPKISDLYSSDKILISTVTNCQGIEGTYTIIYMHHYQSPGAMWFFKESSGAYKRLNVAITRQREGLQLLLADKRSHWIKVCDEKINNNRVGPNTRRSAELMKALLSSAGEQTDTTYLDRKLGQNTTWFDSPLTEQLYNKLREYYSERIGRDLKIYSEVGWNLLIPTGAGIDANERNVGFRIDLGIYSILQKKFILGIEMDGAMYHSGFDKEHSDYNRQKVLEEKGWNLYRIWSTNWLNDNEKEFSRLTQVIDDKL